MRKALRELSLWEPVDVYKRQELQSGICFVPAGTSANPDLLSDLSETYSEWRGEWSRKIIGMQIELET